jgi:hypothetical protein
MPSNPGIDWTRLSRDGREFEQFTRDLMNALGYRAAWSGQGPDGGRDLIAMEPGVADFGGFARKWLVSCKDNAFNGRAVGFADVREVPGRLAQHGCQGFLLVCTTHPSSGLMETFRGWRDNTPYLFHYWDEPILHLLLRRSEASTVLATYFPTAVLPGTEAGPGVVPTFQKVKSHPTARELLFYVEAPGIAFYFETEGYEGLFPDDGTAHYREFDAAWTHLAAELPHLNWAMRGVFYSDSGEHNLFLWNVDVAPRSPNQELDADMLGGRISDVLGHRWVVWHGFTFRLCKGPLDPITPRSDREAELRIRKYV